MDDSTVFGNCQDSVALFFLKGLFRLSYTNNIYEHRISMMLSRGLKSQLQIWGVYRQLSSVGP